MHHYQNAIHSLQEVGGNQFCGNLWELEPGKNSIMCAIATDLSLIALNPRNSVKVRTLECNSMLKTALQCDAV